MEILIRHYKVTRRLQIVDSLVNMERSGNKVFYKTLKRRTVFGIKLPVVQPCPELKIKTITDVDPDFYSMVENRPIRPNTSYLTYKENIRNIARNNATKGFIQDEIQRINKKMEHEKNIYEKTARDFEDYKKSYDKFLAHDNDQTIDVMKRSDNLAKDVANQIHEHKQASFELATMKSKLQYLNESIMILRSFEKFLHKASPVLWRKSHNVQIDSDYPDIYKADNDIFLPINIQTIQDRIKNLPPRSLYFEAPEQLIDVFDALQKQNLNFLLATEEIRSHKFKTLKAVEDFKGKLQEETNIVNINIQEIDDLIKLKELRETELCTIFFTLLEEKMKELIVSETSLKMYNALEFTYNHIVAPNDIKLNVVKMCRALESEYNNLMFELTLCDPRQIKKIEKDIYQTGERKLKQAIRANKLLKDVDKLHKRLNRCFDPSVRPLNN